MILPKAVLDELGLSLGAKIDVRVENGNVVGEPVKRKVRVGWADAARDIGANPLTQEEQDWLDFDDPVEGDLPPEWLETDEER